MLFINILLFSKLRINSLCKNETFISMNGDKIYFVKQVFRINKIFLN